MKISNENKMNKVEKDQYQHNGNGTVVMIKKNYTYKPTRQFMNNHKQVTSLIRNEKGNKVILAGIHADNGNGKKKWITLE